MNPETFYSSIPGANRWTREKVEVGLADKHDLPELLNIRVLPKLTYVGSSRKRAGKLSKFSCISRTTKKDELLKARD